MKAFFRNVSIALTVFLIVGFLFKGGFVLAQGDSFCPVDADVMLVLDVSGSMADGAAQSKCQWSEIKAYGGGSTWFLNTKYDVSENWCANVRNFFDESVPNFQFVPLTYTPEVPSKIESAKSAAKSFLNNLKSQDQSGLITFSTTAQLVKSLSSDHAATKTAIDAVVTGGSTDIGDAIAFAITEFNGSANPQATKTIILLTDGMANQPYGTGYGEFKDDVDYAKLKASEAGALGYKIFTIGLGTEGVDINADMLRYIANITGAIYHHVPNGDGLIDIYQAISTEMCQYGSISGCKYSDLNNNGIINGTEPKLSGWDIVLSGGMSSTQTTDVSGCYTFAGLSAGSYAVSEGANAGKNPFIKTYPVNPYNIILSQGANLTDYNFANYLPVCGNGIIDQAQNEQCDDGNTSNGDGCSSACQTEIIAECTPNQQQSCSTGLLGVCSAGTKTCGQDGFWGSCVQNAQASTEICSNGLDDDCDGNIDNNDSDCQQGGDGDGSGIQPGDIVIDEVMENPKVVSDITGEWFEVYNATSSPIDLSGCIIRDDAINTHIITSLLVPAHGYSVLARSANLATNGGITPDYVYSNFSLGNSSDQIVLECNQAEIDRVNYDSSFPLADGASMILGNLSADNNVGANWCVSTSVYGAGDKGTPGAANDSCGGGGGACVGSYTITATAGTNGTINPSGAVSVPCETSKTFTITPSSGFKLADLLVDGLSVVSPSNSYIFNNVTSDHTISASFSVIESGGGGGGGTVITYYTITATAGTNGAISPSGSISVEQGSDQTFSISPNSGSAVLDVLVDGVSVGAVNTYTFFNVGSSHTISASFFQRSTGGGGGGGGGGTAYLITSSAGPGGSIDPLGTIAVNYGYSKVYTMLPSPGYEVEDVLVDGVSVGALNTYVFTFVVSNSAISVSFKQVSQVAGAATEALYIFDEHTGELVGTSIILTWKTNLPATSRVVYDTVPRPGSEEGPNYGYSFSTQEDSEKTTYHIVLLSGLKRGITYYWRAVSHGSGEVLGKELPFTLGEELYTGTGGPLPPQPAETKPEQVGQTSGATEQQPASTVTTTEETAPVVTEELGQNSQEAFLAALPFQRLFNFLKSLYWLSWLLLLIIIIYLLYRAYRRYLERKNKT